MWRSPATWPASCSWASRTPMICAPSRWSSATRSAVSCSAMRLRLARAVLLDQRRAGLAQTLQGPRRLGVTLDPDRPAVGRERGLVGVGGRRVGAVAAGQVLEVDLHAGL